jgi:hypothetical protein
MYSEFILIELGRPEQLGRPRGERGDAGYRAARHGRQLSTFKQGLNERVWGKLSTCQ